MAYKMENGTVVLKLDFAITKQWNPLSYLNVFDNSTIKIYSR